MELEGAVVSVGASAAVGAGALAWMGYELHNIKKLKEREVKLQEEMLDVEKQQLDTLKEIRDVQVAST